MTAQVTEVALLQFCPARRTGAVGLEQGGRPLAVRRDADAEAEPDLWSEIQRQHGIALIG